jgi:hypothetical protein
MPRFVALEQLSLGDVVGAQKDHAQASRLLTDGLNGMTRFGERLGIHGALDSFAALAAGEKQWSRAVILAAAAESLRTSTGHRAWPVVEARRNRWLEHARDHLTNEEFTSAWAEGSSLTLEQAVNHALNELRSGNPRPRGNDG